MKKNIKDFFLALIFVLLLAIIFFTWLTAESKGHYEGTETRQPDGNYYIWVED